MCSYYIGSLNVVSPPSLEWFLSYAMLYCYILYKSVVKKMYVQLSGYRNSSKEMDPFNFFFCQFLSTINNTHHLD
jgi:hypothetical protein